MALIKSHSYTINLANVQYIRPHTHTDATIFKMISNDHVKITCPYDVVMRQLVSAMNPMSRDTRGVITLDY